MSDDFLARWSRRKLASKAGPDRPTADAIPVPTGIQSTVSAPAVAHAPAGTQSTSTAGPDRPTADVVPAQAGTQSPLPSVESLTPDSDFTPFMTAEVDPGTKRRALKALFQDPRFNVMDGLDVYIDDYSKPDPLPAGWLEKMNQFAHLGDRGQRDRDEAAKAEAAAQAPQAVPPAEKIEPEQLLAATPVPAPADTSDAAAPPSGLRES